MVPSVTDEPPFSLAFFHANDYLVQPINETEVAVLWWPGKTVAALSEEDIASLASRGIERVTRDELFARCPPCKQDYERLQKQFADTGSA
jgi:hypothetical protein